MVDLCHLESTKASRVLSSFFFIPFPSHPNKSGLGSARKLSESLIETVKKEYEAYKASQQAPLGFGSVHGYAPPPGMIYFP